MAPRLNRPQPPYVQIANHYRDAILSGELAPGSRLPSVADVARTWDVATATAAKALGQLQVEGAVYSSPRGTFVADEEKITRTPMDRAHGGSARRHETPHEEVEVTAAAIVTAPNYVAELLGLEIGELVIRREEITHRRGNPVMLSVDWIPGHGQMESAELTSPEPLPGGTLGMVERSTRRKVTHGRDYLEGRPSDKREADALGLPVGGPILAGTHVWSDNEGAMLYGEWVLPSKQVISYEYQPELEDSATG